MQGLVCHGVKSKGLKVRKSFLNCCTFGGFIAYGGSQGKPEFTHLPGASVSEGGTCLAGDAFIGLSAGSELGLFKVHAASTGQKLF